MIVCDKCKMTERHFLNQEIKPVKIEMTYDPGGRDSGGKTLEIQLCKKCADICMDYITVIVDKFVSQPGIVEVE